MIHQSDHDSQHESTTPPQLSRPVRARTERSLSHFSRLETLGWGR
jgi:hypothetical protein